MGCTVCSNYLFYFIAIVGYVCLNSALNVTTPTANKFQVEWIPSQKSRLDFLVKTDGVARLTIKGATDFPLITAFIGVNKIVKYTGITRKCALSMGTS